MNSPGRISHVMPSRANFSAKGYWYFRFSILICAIIEPSRQLLAQLQNAENLNQSIKLRTNRWIDKCLLDFELNPRTSKAIARSLVSIKELIITGETNGKKLLAEPTSNLLFPSHDFFVHP